MTEALELIQTIKDSRDRYMQQVVFDVTMTREQFNELSATIAGAWLEDAYLDNVWTEDDNGDEVYTEEAQDRFNDIYDTVQSILQDVVELERKDR